MSREKRVLEPLGAAVPHAALLRAFDYLAAAVFGATGGVAAWTIVPSFPPMMVEMLMGMVVGMLAAVPLLALFSWVLGGFQILVVSMQAGMFSGMVGSMTASTALPDVAFEGLLVGLIIQLLVHTADRTVAGEVDLDG